MVGTADEGSSGYCGNGGLTDSDNTPNDYKKSLCILSSRFRRIQKTLCPWSQATVTPEVAPMSGLR